MDGYFDDAERRGEVAAHTAPLVLVGDSGAGKTSLALTLRHKSLPPEPKGPPKTLGVEETLVEVSKWWISGHRNDILRRPTVIFISID